MAKWLKLPGGALIDADTLAYLSPFGDEGDEPPRLRGALRGVDGAVTFHGEDARRLHRTIAALALDLGDAEEGAP